MIFYVLTFWLEIPSELLRINIPIKCAFLVELPSLKEFIALERVTELQRIDHKSTGETCNHPFHTQCISPYGTKISIHRFQNLPAFPTDFYSFSTEIERARHSEIRFERTQTKDARFNNNNSCCYEFGANQRLVRYKETFLDVLRSKVDRERLRSHFLGNLRFCSKNTPTECVQYEISLLQTWAS